MAHPALAVLKKLVVSEVIDRVVDRKKPLTGKTSLATGGAIISAATLCPYALTLLDNPDPKLQAVGGLLLAASAFLAIYKEAK